MTRETEEACVRLLRETSKGYREIAGELSLPWRSMLTRIARKHGLRGYAHSVTEDLKEFKADVQPE